jgi:hypothetical protein
MMSASVPPVNSAVGAVLEAEYTEDSVKQAKRNSLPRAMKQLWNKGSHHGKRSKEKEIKVQEKK